MRLLLFAMMLFGAATNAFAEPYVSPLAQQRDMLAIQTIYQGQNITNVSVTNYDPQQNVYTFGIQFEDAKCADVQIKNSTMGDLGDPQVFVIHHSPVGICAQALAVDPAANMACLPTYHCRNQDDPRCCP